MTQRRLSLPSGLRQKNRRIDRAEGRTDKRTDGSPKGRMEERADGKTYRRTQGGKEGRTERGTDIRIEEGKKEGQKEGRKERRSDEWMN